MLVTDPFFIDNGVAQSVISGIEAAGPKVVGVFHDIPPNSEVDIVKRCAAMALEKGAEAIVVLGGGSAIDTAKAANVIFSLGGDLINDYSGSQTIPRALRPLVAIPTTAGTGSEVTSSAVIFDKATQRKLSFNDGFLRPSLALLDPELTLSVPPKISAMTGMDALTHAIEACTSVQANPMSEALATQAITIIRANLSKVVEHGGDIEARSQMIIASNMAGIAFDHAMVGVVHAMAHAAGGIAHVPHGLANSIFLPFGMEYNLEGQACDYSRVAIALGMSDVGSDENAAGLAAIDAVRRLRSDLKRLCGLPDRLREAGVQESQLEEIAQGAAEDGAGFYNPREVSFDEIFKKIREAY